MSILNDIFATLNGLTKGYARSDRAAPRPKGKPELRIGDIVKRPDGKRYILIPNQYYVGEFRAIGKDRHPDHAGYMHVEDAEMENLEKVGESS